MHKSVRQRSTMHSRLQNSNMKLLILTAILAVAAADVSHLEAAAKILRQDSEVSPDGAFQWAFETENGITGSAKGFLNNPNTDQAAQVIEGQNQWKSPEGEVISQQYVADENGYQVQGSHIPTPPPIPEPILRALEYIRSHPPAPEKK